MPISRRSALGMSAAAAVAPRIAVAAPDPDAKLLDLVEALRLHHAQEDRVAEAYDAAEEAGDRAEVERLFRDSRAARVMAPTTDALYDFIGRALCGLPLLGDVA